MIQADFWTDKLIDFVGIPSVSTDASHEEAIDAAACWVQQELKDAGLEATIYQGPGHPMVVGRYRVSPQAPTYLVYGHYDVQPANQSEGWCTQPFVPVVKDGALFGRGASDNKGQILAHIAALRLAIEEGLQANVVIVVEGEEEIGSPHLKAMLEEHVSGEDFEAVVVSDTSTVVKGIPTIQYSLRGIVLLEVHLRTAGRNVHSGIFGGTTANAVREAARLVAKLHDKNNRVTLPGFYDNVHPIQPWEHEMLERIPFDKEEYLSFVGAQEEIGEVDYSTNQRRWYRPTLEVHGIAGGYTQEGHKTIVPAEATIKLSARLVADQDPAWMVRCLSEGIEQLVPDYVRCDIEVAAKAQPYLLDASVPWEPLDTILKLQEKYWGEKPVLSRHGGAIPIVQVFEELYASKTILLALGSPDDAVHGKNEKMELDNFVKGIEMLREFWLLR